MQRRCVIASRPFEQRTVPTLKSRNFLENENRMLCRKVGVRLVIEAAFYPRRKESSGTLLLLNLETRTHYRRFLPRLSYYSVLSFSSALLFFRLPTQHLLLPFAPTSFTKYGGVACSVLFGRCLFRISCSPLPVMTDTYP